MNNLKCYYWYEIKLWGSTSNLLVLVLYSLFFNKNCLPGSIVYFVLFPMEKSVTCVTQFYISIYDTLRFRKMNTLIKVFKLVLARCLEFFRLHTLTIFLFKKAYALEVEIASAFNFVAFLELGIKQNYRFWNLFHSPFSRRD